MEDNNTSRGTAQRMMQLFAGLDSAHGTHGEPDRDGLKWTIKRTARTLREPVTLELWLRHLRGERPLGVVPIRDDGSCCFGGIDIDKYDENLLPVIERAERAGLPLVPARSKSGGLHLWRFCPPARAADMRGELRDMAARLGVGGAEIFPKQEELVADRGDVGNWIIVPYFGSTFGGKLREQAGLKRTGGEMTVTEFLAAAERTRCPVGERRGEEPAEPGAPAVPFADGPRCLEIMAKAGGIQEGGRNEVLMMMGIYLKRRQPDNWPDAPEQFNRDLMVPPLAADEVALAKKQLKKRDYEYMCKHEPMKSHCDAAVCRGRRFGVGDGTEHPASRGSCA
jgi:hypothetical protein